MPTARCNAWEFAAAHALTDLLLVAVRGLGQFYQVSGLFQEGVERFSHTAAQVEQKAQLDLPTTKRLLVLLRLMQGRLEMEQGAYTAALACLQQAQATAAMLADPLLIAEVGAEVGIANWRLAEFETGRRVL